MRLRGQLTFGLATAAYAYYTFWLLVTPFVDVDQPLLRLFPDPYYASAVPVFLGVVLLSGTLLTLGGFLAGGELRRAWRMAPTPTAAPTGPADEEDWVQQAEEAMALSSIFGDDFQLVELRCHGGTARPASASGGECAAAAAAGEAAQPPGQPPEPEALLGAGPPPGGWLLRARLTLAVQPPAGRLRVRLSDRDAEPDTRGSASEAGGHWVQYLPPLQLHLSLRRGYPSASPPGVALSALWLSRRAAAALQAQLAGVWEAQGPGVPVVYAWADWLQSEALAHLGAGEALVIGEEGESEAQEGEGGTAPGDAAAAHGGDAGEGCEAGGRPPAEEVLLGVLRWDAAAELRAFRVAEHACAICLDRRPGSEFERLECGHAFCRGCLSEQAALHVGEGSVQLLRCPEPGCAAPLGLQDLRRLLPADGLARWEALTLARTLDAMPDVAYCPRCGAVSLEDADSCAQCPSCLFAFCSLCDQGWHPGTQCVSADTRLAMLRRKAEGGGRAALDDLRRKEAELLSLAAIEEMGKSCKLKRCPQCSAAIEKTEGCNKMVCSNCATAFCFRCGRAVSGYGHFSSGACALFDLDEILRWEMQFEAAVEAERIRAAQLRNDWVGGLDRGGGGGGGGGAGGRGPRARLCPTCGQLNYKMGNNNHMSCWACSNHFCYLCHTPLRARGGSAHFGKAGGCRQHTPD